MKRNFKKQQLLLEEEFYQEYAMTSLQKLEEDPYANRGQDFHRVIQELESMLKIIEERETFFLSESDVLH